MPPAITKDDTISNIYYDLEDGYGSVKNTFEQAQKTDPSILLEDVQKWMKWQPNKQRRSYRGSNSYTAPFPRFEYQMISWIWLLYKKHITTKICLSSY